MVLLVLELIQYILKWFSCGESNDKVKINCWSSLFVKLSWNLKQSILSSYLCTLDNCLKNALEMFERQNHFPRNSFSVSIACWKINLCTNVVLLAWSELQQLETLIEINQPFIWIRENISTRKKISWIVELTTFMSERERNLIVCFRNRMGNKNVKHFLFKDTRI